MTIWRYKAELAVVSSENRVAILDLDRLDQLPVVLTGSAALIWGLLDGRRDDATVARDVAEAFAVDEAEVRSHVLDYLQDLAARDLIVRV